jgi:hypothetical protein
MDALRGSALSKTLVTPTTTPLRWLETRGAARLRAAAEAAEQVLAKYPRSSSSADYVDLGLLSRSLNVHVRWLPRVSGRARLVPRKDGFTAYAESYGSVRSASATWNHPRARMDLAHELAHTLFYSWTEDVPTRQVPVSSDEEHFCFDAARRILAPEWLITSLSKSTRDIGNLYDLLSLRGRISRPTAARLLLSDYGLAQGVAGRWRRDGREWRLERGTAIASSNLSASERQTFRAQALRYLNEEPVSPGYAVDLRMQSDGRAYAMIIREMEMTKGQLSFMLPASRSQE